MDGDLIAFLNTRLDEDEETARATSRPAFRQWHAEPWYDGEFLNDGRTVRADLWGKTGMQFTGQGAIATVMAGHIARHDPARVLREVEAKRAILAVVVPEIKGMDQQIISEWGDSRDEIDAHLPLLRIMAAVYSDHPDYQQEWAPEV
jgi:hypothetical protein